MGLLLELRIQHNSSKGSMQIYPTYNLPSDNTRILYCFLCYAGLPAICIYIRHRASRHEWSVPKAFAVLLCWKIYMYIYY